MSKLLSIDSMLEVAFSENMPGLEDYVAQAESLAIALGKSLANHLPKAAKCSFQTGLNAQRSPRRKPSGLVGGERPQPIMLPVLFVPGCTV